MILPVKMGSFLSESATAPICTAPNMVALKKSSASSRGMTMQLLSEMLCLIMHAMQ